MGGDDGLGAGLGEVMEQGDQAEAGGEGERGVGFVHEVEARLVHPGAQYFQEALSMAELRFAAGVAPVSLWSGIVSGETRWVQEVRPAVWALTGDDLGQQLADARRVLETVAAVPAGHDDTRLGVQPADQELPIG